MDERFEPKIVGFFCNWCTSSAADMAGTSRMRYPANVRPIRVMCSGSVDPSYVLRALLSGADAVMLGGCHPGDCHYISGNYKARRRIAILMKVLETVGLEEDRINLEWISASEGKKFVNSVTKYTDVVKKLGENPLSKKWAV